MFFHCYLDVELIPDAVDDAQHVCPMFAVSFFTCYDLLLN